MAFPTLDQNGNYVASPGNPFSTNDAAGALLFSANVSGSGPPTHTPRVSLQWYKDRDTGQMYNYDPTNGWDPAP